MTLKHINAAKLKMKSLDIRNNWMLSKIMSPNLPVHRLIINIMLLTCTVPIIMVMIAKYIDNNYYLKKPAVGLFQDWNILFMFVTYPVALILLNNVCSKFNIFMTKISDVITVSQTYEKDIDDIHISVSNIIFNNKRLWQSLRVILFGCGILFVYFNAYNRYFRSEDVYFKYSFWTSSEYTITFWVTNVYTTIVWGILSPLIGYSLLQILAAIYLINKKLIEGSGYDLRLISTDSMGGLKPLADLALSMCYITIPFQIHAMAYYLWIHKINTPFIVGSSTIIVSSILMFIIPVVFTHTAMVDARRRMLEPISDEADKQYRLIMSKIDVNACSYDEIKEQIRQVRYMNELYGIVNKIKVWPFDIETIGRFAATLLVPLIAAITKALQAD